MNEPRERLFWVIALTLSITAHAAFVLLMPGVAVKPDIKPIMRVRLAMVEKKTPTVAPLLKQDVPVEKKAASPKEAAPKKQVQKKAEPVKTVKTPAEKAPVQEVQAQGNPGIRETENTGYEKTAAAPADTGPKAEVRPQTERVVELNTLEVVKKVLPDYSSFSRKRKEEGTVKIIATVTDGRVVNAEIESSSGFQRLDESALRAVRQWMFKNSGTVRVRVPVTFRLR
ncbi:MAG: TonB family protein [Synergistaceae bacterium]